MLWTTFCRRGASSLRTPLGHSKLKSRSLFQTYPSHFPRTARVQSGRLPDGHDSFPSFRTQVVKTEGVSSFSARLEKPSIRKQLQFFLGVSLLAYVGAAALTESETKYWKKKLVTVSSMFQLRPPSTDEMRRARYMELGGQLKETLNQLKDETSTWPGTLRNVFLATYVRCAQTYLDWTEGRRLCFHIACLNAAVFLAWKVPRLRSFMWKSFTHDPLSGRAYTLLTSVFSHKSFLHLMANNMALCSFGSAATTYFYFQQRNDQDALPEATSIWHFLAFFLSAGMFSGLVSHVVSTKILFPRLVARASTQASIRASPAASAIAGSTNVATAVSQREIMPSLGASGAVYAAVTLSALAFPDAEVRLLFPPFFPIPITTGVGGIILLDIVGVIRGWKLFDHYAHLGGAAFGALYYYYGTSWWNFARRLEAHSLP
ncbi:hypothetical protein F5141DRAFT_1051357 [Pisolithus sp. B1]|nr:hypothetical protein F5141DRAFT_1051357 [Pisolithus sp. B1]